MLTLQSLNWIPEFALVLTEFGWMYSHEVKLDTKLLTFDDELKRKYIRPKVISNHKADMEYLENEENNILFNKNTKILEKDGFIKLSELRKKASMELKDVRGTFSVLSSSFKPKQIQGKKFHFEFENDLAICVAYANLTMQYYLVKTNN